MSVEQLEEDEKGITNDALGSDAEAVENCQDGESNLSTSLTGTFGNFLKLRVFSSACCLDCVLPKFLGFVFVKVF